jgi:SIR2-like domain
MPEQLDTLDPHYKTVIKAITDGRLVPFLGAGVNLCGRPQDMAWQRGQYLPSGGELAAYLAENFGYPGSDRFDLVRVSQYIAVVTGSGPLYEELHSLFDVDYPPTPLHQFLATLPALLREKGYPPRYQLIVTTNYDDLVERAFREAGEPFDLVAYVTEGEREQRGKFVHWPPDGEARLIEKPNEYRGLSLDQRPVILKIHGAVDRTDAGRDSYVITEDHYIDYLTHTDISNLVPVTLAAKLKKSHFLFLGYSLRDWNLRVILHRIWGEQTLTYKSWAIQLNPEPIERKFWNKRDVDILDVRLEEYVAALRERLQALVRPGGGT